MGIFWIHDAVTLGDPCADEKTGCSTSVIHFALDNPSAFRKIYGVGFRVAFGSKRAFRSPRRDICSIPSAGTRSWTSAHATAAKIIHAHFNAFCITAGRSTRAQGFPGKKRCRKTSQDGYAKKNFSGCGSLHAGPKPRLGKVNLSTPCAYSRSSFERSRAA